MYRLFFLVILWLAAWQPALSLAACKQETISQDAFNKASNLGVKLIEQLERLNPRVALVGRAGTDLSKYGLKYSHAGLVFRNHPKGKWVFTHLLVRCGETVSKLYDEGAITFFSDNPHKYQAILIVPNPALQIELEKLLLEGTARNLHEGRYSVIANPDKLLYQNSNQWVLEMLAVAKSIYLPADQRRHAIKLAMEYGFQPETVKVGFFKRHLAAMFHPHVKLDDHSQDDRLSGKFSVVTVKSIKQFLEINHDVESITEIDLLGSRTNTYQPPTPKTKPHLTIRHRQPVSRRTSQSSSATDFWH